MRALRSIGRKEGGINIKKRSLRRRGHSSGKGRLSIVGIGPGAPGHLSRRAAGILRDSQVVVGYAAYIKLLGTLTAGKDVISSGMTQEVDRTRTAIAMARKGRRVCLVSSGDPGVYGMASLALELIGSADGELFDIEIIPGIMAGTACASRLGAPLSHDFAVISLSDLLTDSREIEKKIRLAAEADFVIVLYNPKSKKRTRLLDIAWRIVMKYRHCATPVGIVKNAYRLGEKMDIIPLEEAIAYNDIDMLTTVIIGNSRTYVKDGYMITPRGYRIRKGAG